jgi:hypothetical protein
MLQISRLNNFLFFSFFIIFIRIVPIGIETQPLLSFVYAILLICTYFMYLDKSEYLNIKKDVLCVVLLLVVLLFYTVAQAVIYLDTQAIVEFAKYLIGPVIYIALRHEFSIKFKVLKIIVYSLMGLALLNLFLPSVYNLIFGIFIPRSVDSVAGGIRGITILTPEPSYFSVFQIILLLTIEDGLSKNSSIPRKKLLRLKYLVIFMTLLTKSAFVMGVSVIFLIPDIKQINLKKVFLFIGIIAPLIIVTMFVFVPENRFFQVIQLLYTAFSSGEFDITNFLFNQEASGGTRLLVNFFAMSAIFMHPFGSGLGSFSDMINSYASNFGMDISRHEVLGSKGFGKIYPQTYFANLCNDIGVFALLLVPIIMLNYNKTDPATLRFKRNFCIFFMIFFQSQITNPAFWYVIALSKQRDNDLIYI